MLQEIIVALIVGSAIIAALIYVYRMVLRIKRREAKCSCCNCRNTCGKYAEMTQTAQCDKILPSDPNNK